MKTTCSYILALMVLVWFASCSKSDPARPAPRPTIDAPMESFDLVMLPDRSDFDEIGIVFTDSASGVKYAVEIDNVDGNAANCTATINKTGLFLPGTKITYPMTPSGSETFFIVTGTNDSLAISIDITSATPEQIRYLETKKIVFHFTPETKVYFQENSAGSVQPYLKPGGLVAAKAFYEAMLKQIFSGSKPMRLTLDRY